MKQTTLKKISNMRETRYAKFKEIVKEYEELKQRKVNDDELEFLCNVSLK